jgi:hypothetical protein
MTTTTAPAAVPADADSNDWKRYLRDLSRDLDLETPNGRASFEFRLMGTTKGVKVRDLRAVLHAFGHGMVPTARRDVVRDLAYRWALMTPAQRVPASGSAPMGMQMEQARAISTLADSLADGTVIGPRYAAVQRLAEMVKTLEAWTPDDRA